MTLSVLFDSNSVEIDTSKAESGDFLCCYLKYGTRVFLRWVPENGSYTFDEDLLPQGFAAGSYEPAKKWLCGLAKSGKDTEELLQLFDARRNKDQCLAKFVAQQMCRGVTVNSIDSDRHHYEHPNIGLKLSAHYRPPVQTGNGMNPWTSGAPIVRIVPMTRIEALLEDARNAG